MAYTSQLTDRQLKTYECIIDFIKEFGFAPTVRELCEKNRFYFYIFYSWTFKGT